MGLMCWLSFQPTVATREARMPLADLVGDRGYPIVLLALALQADRPRVRATPIVTDSSVRIYLLLGHHSSRRPAAVCNSHLAVPRGSARICWPRFSDRSDPGDHPLVWRYEGASDGEALEEFARRFDLSRPRLRREIKLIDTLRAPSQLELDQARARLERDRAAAERRSYRTPPGLTATTVARRCLR